MHFFGSLVSSLGATNPANRIIRLPGIITPNINVTSIQADALTYYCLRQEGCSADGKYQEVGAIVRSPTNAEIRF